MNKIDISSLFEIWNNALQTGDPKKVAELYETNAILLPTVSNKVRHNHEEIADYFVNFLAKGPVGKIDESNVRTLAMLRSTPGSTPSLSRMDQACKLDFHMFTDGTVKTGVSSNTILLQCLNK